MDSNESDIGTLINKLQQFTVFIWWSLVISGGKTGFMDTTSKQHHSLWDWQRQQISSSKALVFQVPGEVIKAENLKIDLKLTSFLCLFPQSLDYNVVESQRFLQDQETVLPKVIYSFMDSFVFDYAAFTWPGNLRNWSEYAMW